MPNEEENKFQYDLKEFCRRIPKVELHAHLNGSLSIKTLKKLHSNLQIPDEEFQSWDHLTTDLDKCFTLFSIAHKLTITPENVYEAACDVIEEFAEDNVVYLELRSTPREVFGSMTQEQYIDALIRAAREKSHAHNIIVKILISINRKERPEIGMKNVLLAIEAHKQHPDIVVGIDLSGQPNIGKFNTDFRPLCEKARINNLKIALHCGEILDDDNESKDIINFKPERLGHCIYVHPDTFGSYGSWERLLQLKIPVEICLTSNLKTDSVKDLKDHHLKYLLNLNHPFILGTDDKGVFNTTLSNEYYLAASTFNLSRNDIWNYLLKSVNYIFGTQDDKNRLLQVIEAKKKEIEI